MNGIQQPLPKARKSQLITKEVAGEMLVYDRNSDEAHCFNPTAAWVWAYCDGTTTVAEVARLLTDEMQTPVAAEVVWLALEQLRKSRLLHEPPLQEPLAGPGQMQHLSRRALVKRLGGCGGGDGALHQIHHRTDCGAGGELFAGQRSLHRQLTVLQ